MSLEIPNPKAMLEIVALQEETLQFERFTMEETWELGLLIRRQVLNHGGNAAVDVTLGGVQLFRCGVGQPSPNNARWIRRKMNLVQEQWKSSLRVMLEMTLSQRTLETYGLCEAEYALSGGCFPILVRGTGVVGTATVSGLPQTHDHQMVVNALSEFLGLTVPSVLTVAGV